MLSAHSSQVCKFSLYDFVHYEEIPGFNLLFSVYKDWPDHPAFSLLMTLKGRTVLYSI